jgi:hypothetical protein
MNVKDYNENNCKAIAYRMIRKYSKEIKKYAHLCIIKKNKMFGNTLNKGGERFVH